MRTNAVLARAAAALFASCIALAASSAAAAEREWHAGANAGWALLAGGGASANGFGASLHLDYGITDAFNLVGNVDFSAHPSAHVLVPSVRLGAVYVVDILSVVPYVGLTAGGADVWISDKALCPNGSCHQGKLALAIPFGADYQLSRSFAIGGAGRYELLLGSGSALHMITAGVNAEFLWGY
jgi:hypothetical protein